MVIGDSLGYSSLGLGSGYAQKSSPSARQAVTLDAEVDPKTPHQYSVSTKQQIIPPPERAPDATSSGKKAHQNSDPASRVFLAIADYQPQHHRIDITV